MTVYCATSNPGKLREFQLAAQRWAATSPQQSDCRPPSSCGRYGELGEGFDVRPLPSSIPAPEEHGSTFEENAIAKAVYYSPFADGYLFADDSGLEVDALGGAPGVYSARYAGPDANDEANNALLLKLLEGVENRAARFVCAIALAKNDKLISTFHGVVEGRILDRPSGQNGFGYDPLFYYPPFLCTFGQASLAQKMLVSHRAQALAKLFSYLRGIAAT